MIILYCAELDELLLFTGFEMHEIKVNIHWQCSRSVEALLPPGFDLFADYEWFYVGHL